MADSNIDAYLLLMKDGEPVAGESTDTQYGEKGALPVQSFALTFSGMSLSDDDDDATSDSADSAKARAKAETQMRFGPSKPQTLSPKDLKAILQTGGGSHGKGSSKKKLPPCSFTIDRLVDAASCQLFMLYCNNAQRPDTAQGSADDDKAALIQSAKFTFRKGGGDVRKFIVIYFGGLLVTSYSVEIDPEDGPKEKVSLSFAQCEIAYDIQQSTGQMNQFRTMFGWDFQNPADWSHP